MEESLNPEITEKGDFSQGSIPRAIMRLALPITLAQLIHILYSVVDRIYLGHLPGVEHLALTGVGITMPVIYIILSFSALCSYGGGPLFAITRGKGEDGEAERIMGNTFVVLLLLGITLTLVITVFKKPVLYLFGASDDTYPFASAYLSIYSIGTVFAMLSYGMNPFINAQGFGRTGMMTVAIGAVLNIILDPIFIFVLGMGVRGAALATIISQFFSTGWVMIFLTGRRAVLHLRLSCMKLQAVRVRKILALGLSGFFMNLTTSLTQIVCNVVLQRYGGDLYVGIMTVINSLREIVVMPIQGMMNGSTPVIGYNFGAGKTGRVRQSIKFFISAASIYAAVLWVVLMLLPGMLIRIFNTDEQLVRVGVPAVRIYFGFFIFMSMQMTAQGVFLGLGRTRNAIFFSLLRKAFIAAPLTIIFPLLGMGTNGVFIAEAVSQFIGGLACFGTMYFVVYRKLKQDSGERLGGN